MSAERRRPIIPPGGSMDADEFLRRVDELEAEEYFRTGPFAFNRSVEGLDMEVSTAPEQAPAEIQLEQDEEFTI